VGAITDITGTEENPQSAVLHVRLFRNLEGVHSDWAGKFNKAVTHVDMKAIHCYQAKSGLEEEVIHFGLHEVVGKCVPFLMDNLKTTEPNPTKPKSKTDRVSDEARDSADDRWWVLVRLKHTCGPKTLIDV
jgi:hypothetical protein